MAFSLKTWVNRISEYPNRRRLTHEDGSTELVTVARAEGQISAEGNAFSAEEMNDLENRIKGGFDEVNQSLTEIKSEICKNNWTTTMGNINAKRNGNIVELEIDLQILINAFSGKRETIRVLPSFAIPSIDKNFVCKFANTDVSVVFTASNDGLLYLYSYDTLPIKGFHHYDTLTYIV